MKQDEPQDEPRDGAKMNPGMDPKTDPKLDSSTDPSAEAALDEDRPGEIEKTFAVLMTLAGVLCLIPRQWVSAGILFSCAVVVTSIVVWRRRSGR